MSDATPPFIPPQPPLMSPQKARDVGRAYEAFSDHLTEFGLAREAALAMRDSQWWLAYSIALAQTSKDGGEATSTG